MVVSSLPPADRRLVVTYARYHVEVVGLTAALIEADLATFEMIPAWPATVSNPRVQAFPALPTDMLGWELRRLTDGRLELRIWPRFVYDPMATQFALGWFRDYVRAQKEKILDQITSGGRRA
jgi:hypothetical protein